ncbi:TonB-dependent receptor [Colwellia piezophila]|uniref:TonB-dependent receptor n=1 Tax=Colwellia piezophila TaxID=211668 RepID=UPI00036B5563|nr:TonB-dependent receptor [Colwellia piezophila]
MKKSKISLALIAALYIQVPTQALAQEAEVNTTNETKAVAETKTAKEKAAENEAAIKRSDIEVITIGGMRSSEIAAINMKKFAMTISDNLSAEEIGALPGPSIAESLERLTGVTGNQNEGRSDSVSVRGMGGQYTLTTLNDRQIVAPWGSRSANLSLFPGAAIRKAQVYKTSRADSIEGGIAGQINMETFKPLEVDKNIFSFNAGMNSGEQVQDLTSETNDTFLTNIFNKDKWGRSIDGLVSYHLSDDLAVSLAYSWKDDVEFTEKVKSGELQGKQWPRDINEDGINDYFMTAVQLQPQRQDRVQKSVVGALQWTPNDDLLISVDVMLANYDYQGTQNQWSAWGLNNVLTDPALMDIDPDTGILMGGMSKIDSHPHKAYNGADVDSNWSKGNVTTDNRDEIRVFGLNFDYTLTDNLALNVDLAHSTSDNYYSWRSVSGVYGDDMNHYFNFGFHDEEIMLEYLGSDVDGEAYNADTYTLDPSQLTHNLNNPDLFYIDHFGNSNSVKESAVSAVKFDLTWDVDLAMVHQIKFGGRYSRNTKEDIADVEDYQGDTIDINGNFVSGNTRAPAPGEESDGKTTFTDEEWTAQWAQMTDVDYHALNMDLTTNPWQNMDGVTGFDDTFHLDARTFLAQQAPFFPERVFSENDRYSSYEIKEDTTAAYVQAAFAGDWYDGVFGVRYYKTVLDSTSFGTDFTLELRHDGTTGKPIKGVYDLVPGENPRYITETFEYEDLLPTLNVNFRFIDDVIIRVGLGQAMIRPSISEIHSSIQLKSKDQKHDANQEAGQNGEVSSISLGKAGNPRLEPITSTQADISFEWYPTQWDYYSIAAFYKDLDGLYAVGSTYMPVKYAKDKNGDPVTLPFTSEQKQEGGDVTGIELSMRQSFAIFHESLGGIALSANYMKFFHNAYQDYNYEYPGGTKNKTKATELWHTPSGWIDSTYNIALTFDDGRPFSARINYNYQGGTPVPDGPEKFVLQYPGKNLSVSLKYKVSKEVSIFAAANNLTNEVTTRGNLSSKEFSTPSPHMVYDIQARGITYYGGIRINF